MVREREDRGWGDEGRMGYWTQKCRWIKEEVKGGDRGSEVEFPKP